MLRASAESHNIAINLSAVTNSKLSSGLEHGDILLAFADAVTGSNQAEMETTRAELRERMGEGALVQASAIAANFSMNDRAANAIGIPMESFFLADSVEFRALLGINDFPSARNTPGT